MNEYKHPLCANGCLFGVFPECAFMHLNILCIHWLVKVSEWYGACSNLQVILIIMS